MSMSELVLRRGEMEEYSTLHVETHFLSDGRLWVNKRSKELRGNSHVGEFAEKETYTYAG